MNIKNDVGTNADFQKLINYLITDNGIKSKEIAVAMGYNNGVDAAVNAFKKKGEPSWSRIQGLLKLLYKLDSNFSADDLFKDDSEIPNTTEEETIQIPFKQLSAEYKKLQAKYDKLLKQHNNLLKKQSKYQDLATVFEKLTDCQRDTFCRFVNTSDLIEFLKILRMFSERKLKMLAGGKYTPDKKTFFVFYDFSKISTLLDVMCEQTTLGLREDILTEKRIKYKDKFVAQEKQRIADEIKTILLSFCGTLFMKNDLKCSPATLAKRPDFIDPDKIKSKAHWHKFAIDNPYPPDSADFYLHIAQHCDTYDLDQREQTYKKLAKMQGITAPEEPYHYVNGGENLPRYRYQSKEYTPLFTDDNSVAVEEWYYGDLPSKKNMYELLETENDESDSVEPKKKLDNAF